MLKKILVNIIGLLCISVIAFSQNAKITGKIINAKTGEPLIGATISIQKFTYKTKSDLNGNFSIGGLAAGTYTIISSFVSFDSKLMEGITVKNNEVITVDVVLQETKNELGTVVVKSNKKVSGETVNALVIAQKNNANVSDGISAETIKKTPDKNTSDILKRVSGASIQDDRFVIVRGLNDRYNAAYINNAPLPSSEADRKAFAYDIFPANLLDNLVIYKTATPDLPGEFAGGLIFVNTKDIPAKNFVSYSIGAGYNSLSTFKDRKYYDGSGTDFLGYDNGLRALPTGIPGFGQIPESGKESAKLSMKFWNHWKTYTGQAAPNMNLQFVEGLNIQNKGKDFIGMLFSLTYNRSFNYTEGVRRSHEDFDTAQTNAKFEEKIYTTQTLLAGMANFSVKINKLNSISFKNIGSINSDDKIIEREGNPNYSSDAGFFSRGNVRWFTSNKILSNQLAGDHYINKLKLKINWVLSNSAIRREMPQVRSLIYTKLGAEPYRASISRNTNPSDGNGGSIYYSDLKESIKHFKLDLQHSFKIGKAIQNQIKGGVYYQYRDRNFSSRNLGFIQNNRNGIVFDQSLLLLPEGEIFEITNMNVHKNPVTGRYGGGFILSEEGKRFSNNYTGSNELTAGYLMLDQRVAKFRLIYGVRMENFKVKMDLPKDVNASDKINTTKTDYLPSANLIYSLNAKQNIRLSYSKTVNRPEFRELAPAKFFDFATRYTSNGDTALRRAIIDNFDIRYEIYPGRGQLLTVSGFYKKMKDAIEFATNPEQPLEAAPLNAREATIKGVELEARIIIGTVFKIPQTSILNKITFYTNLAVIKSSVVDKTVGDTSKVVDRPLQGQSPYVFNAGFNYQDDAKGWSVSLAGNRVGQRIFIVGNLKNLSIWENGRTVIDLQIAKLLLKKSLEIKINAKDLFAQKLKFFEDNNDNKKYDKGDYIRWTRAYGRTFSVNFTYKF